VLLVARGDTRDFAPYEWSSYRVPRSGRVIPVDDRLTNADIDVPFESRQFTATPRLGGGDLNLTPTAGRLTETAIAGINRQLLPWTAIGCKPDRSTRF
jgi:hypothetical protein